MDAEFMTDFQERYQRNTKATGRKNIRCFPGCLNGKHTTTGFCGSPVKIMLRNLDTPASRLRCWATFERVSGGARGKKGDSPAFVLGQRVSLADVLQSERSRAAPVLPLLRGSVHAGEVNFDCNGLELMTPRSTGTVSPVAVDSDGTATVVINMERAGWHYSWVSNKHTADSMHALKVYVFECSDALAPGFSNEELECVGAFESPLFQIYCRRRQSVADKGSPDSGGEGEAEGEDEGEEGGAVRGSSLKRPAAHAPHSPAARRARQDSDLASPPAAASAGGKKPQPLRRVPSSGSLESSSTTSVLLRLMEHSLFCSFEQPNSPSGQQPSALHDIGANLLGGLITGLGMDDVLGSGFGDENEQGQGGAQPLARQFGSYLVDEQSFTDDMSAFFTEHALEDARSGEMTRDAPLAKLFDKFLEMVLKHVKNFARARGMTVESFMERVESESMELEARHELRRDIPRTGMQEKGLRVTAFRQAFLRRLQTEMRPDPQSTVARQRPVHPDFDINGWWALVPNAEHDVKWEHTKLRLQSTGYLVMVGEFMRKMFWRMHVCISAEQLTLQGERKLMHSGEFNVLLDSHEHKWEASQFVPLGMPAIEMMYRAQTYSTRDGVPTISVNIYGFLPRVDTVRIEAVRHMFILDQGQRLDVVTEISLFRGFSNTKELIASFQQNYVRMVHDDGVSELLKVANDFL
jgi:hypothetical protein